MWVSDSEADAYEVVVDQLINRLELRFSHPASIEEASRSKELGRENLVGVGFGEKLVAGRPTGRPAIAAFVVRKASNAREVREGFLFDPLVRQTLDSKDLSVLDPRVFDLVSDVVEVGRPRLLNHVAKTFSPRVPGAAAISGDGGRSVGTLGAWVTDGTNVFLLTCDHCLASVEIWHPPHGAAISDGRVCVRIMGSAGPGKVTIDACLLSGIPSRAGDFILQIGEVQGTHRLRDTYVKLRKSGAVTHLTHGRAVQLSANVHLDVPSGPKAGQTFFYERQIIIQPSSGPFAAEGDSGALVMKGNHAVGLLVGGTDLPPTYVATPIDPVLDALREKMHSAPLRFVGN